MEDKSIVKTAYCNALLEWKSLGFPGIFWDWLKETYGVEIYFNHNNREIENIITHNHRRFTMFILKHGSN